MTTLAPHKGRPITFNKMFRQKRLQAEREHRPFPSYAKACEKLEEAIAAAKQRGEIASVDQFWSEIFT